MGAEPLDLDLEPFSAAPPAASAAGGHPAGARPSAAAAAVRETAGLVRGAAAECVRRGTAIVEATRHVAQRREEAAVLTTENAKLSLQIKDELHLDAEVRNNHPDDAALFVLTPGELHARLAKATEAWRAEDAKATGMRSRLEAALQVVAAGEETVRREAALRERQTAAAAALARRRHALERVPQLQETSRVQEQVLQRLQAQLDRALQTVAKDDAADRADVTEAAVGRVRERVRELLAQHDTRAHLAAGELGLPAWAADRSAEELRAEVGRRNEEIARLQGLADRLKRNRNSRVHIQDAATADRMRAAELRVEKATWKAAELAAGVEAAERRTGALEAELESSGRKYAEEIARVRLDLSRLETQLDVGI